jgi:hypothetical protein
MFIDRLMALKIFIDKANDDLLKEPFADTISFGNLNLVDPIPDEILNLYDATVETYDDLLIIGTTRLRRAILQANIVEGELDTVDILDPGFGYKVAPPVIITGDGVNAEAEIVLDSQGRVISVNITNRGKKYSTCTAEVRYYSVLVNSDRTINNFWSIYSYDNTRKTWFRQKTQAYDTTKYWSYIDWYAEGYNSGSRIIKEVLTILDESSIVAELGDLIRIKEYGAGGWIILEKISLTGDSILDKYKIVGRQNGTIKISSSFYKPLEYGQGFDAVSAYDINNYDLNATAELRNIIQALKSDVYVADYAYKWNELFFSSIRYVLSEQQYVDWVFKTSFMNAIHNIGALEQKTNYKNDNLDSYKQYIEEVKPYRTTVREYVSRYNTVEPYGAATTDFDLPPALQTGSLKPVNTNSDLINTYPWKWWLDNLGFSIDEILITDAGSNYTAIPKVVITGDGTGAEAIAFISSGRVTGIQVINSGSGYTYAPEISLVGGTAAGVSPAKATAVLGNSLARSFNLRMKFDRMSKEITHTDFERKEDFIANGYSGVFNLNYAPTRDKSLISVLKNNEVLFDNQYVLNLYYDNSDGFNLLKGKLVIIETPAANDTISIRYEINDELLGSVDRIRKYYEPTSGMKSKELNQLMTGIDFGGVQIQGTTFEVTGGWDALPWFTDNWDSVEASSDYYVICDGSTVDVLLPYTPAEGQQITVYIKRSGTVTPGQIDTLGPDNAPIVVITPPSEPTSIERIDDPFYTDDDSSSSPNPKAQMPTFVGDGSTRIIEIGRYIEVQAGDILIFRPIESDGSVTITDANLLDTQISGGNLTASGSTGTNISKNTIDGIYSSARGIAAEDINIDGGKFISPEQVPSPEENIPGQVSDSLSIKVYTFTQTGAATLNSRVLVSDGSTQSFNIGQHILKNNSVIVYVDKIKQEYGIDYTINWNNNGIDFGTAPNEYSIIEILSFGLGGAGILDYQEFIADGQVVNYLTAANYVDTTHVYVTVDGVEIDAGFFNGTDIFGNTGDGANKTLVQFSQAPASGSVIKIVSLAVTLDSDSSGLSIVKVNNQRFEFEGSTRSFDLTDFSELSRGSSKASVIVTVNGNVLRGVDTTYFEYDGTTNSFTLGTDPLEPSGSILPDNIQVLINGQLKTFITDYVFDGISKQLTIVSDLEIGDRIRIQNNLRTEYDIVGNNLIISPSVSLVSNNETDNDIIEVTWFSEYPTMRILTDEFSGGKIFYTLASTPLSVDYVWVFKNGIRLTKDQDYYVDMPRAVVYLKQSTIVSDLIKIIIYSDSIYKPASAFEIRKDILNVYHYNRFSFKDTALSVNLNYYDQTIEVLDGSILPDPIPSRNIPGAIHVAGERIEYFTKTGNILGQLRRGTQGTSIGEIYLAHTPVSDVGYNEKLPYNETQDRYDFFSDGSTLLVGPLPFIPEKANKSRWQTSEFYVDKGEWKASDSFGIPVFYNLRDVVTYQGLSYTNIQRCAKIDPTNTAYWSPITIPSDNGPCDQIEVFAAGRRLHKNPQTVWSEINGPYSPASDITIEAEFSVDGISSYIRLTEPLKRPVKFGMIEEKLQLHLV